MNCCFPCSVAVQEVQVKLPGLQSFQICKSRGRYLSLTGTRTPRHSRSVVDLLQRLAQSSMSPCGWFKLIFLQQTFFLFNLIRGEKLVTRCPFSPKLQLWSFADHPGKKTIILHFPEDFFVFFLAKGVGIIQDQLVLLLNFYSVHNSGLWPNITCKGGAN